MNYKCRPGIVLVKIVDAWLLIPTRAASELCPTIIKLTLPAMFIWRCLKKGKSKAEMCQVLEMLTHKEQKEVEEMLEMILESFLKNNAIVTDEVRE